MCGTEGKRPMAKGGSRIRFAEQQQNDFDFYK